MIQFLKIFIIYCLRIVLRLFYIIPINKRKILFASYGGKQYSCNPKYIFEYMIKHYGDAYFYIWSLNTPDILPEEYENVKIVKFLSFWYIYHALTSGYIIYNSMVKCYLPFRKNQIIVNTWHGGGAYKTMGLDASPYKKDSISMKVAIKKAAKMVNYNISSCKKFTDISSKLWTMSVEKYLSIGMPRNDIMFNIPDSVIKKVRKYFNVEENTKIVLYAPTFRGDYRNTDNFTFSLNILHLQKTLKNKFGNDFLTLYRSHMYDKIMFDKEEADIICASKYPDMQELLCASDVMITDYSSSIWDFSFTFKPCFLFTPDLVEYKKTTGFYTPIEEWPFSLAETNKQLIENIISFDEEKYKHAVKKHHADLGSYENGTACEQLCCNLFN